MGWYAMFVQTGYEDRICHFMSNTISNVFENINYKLLVPKRKIYERRQGVTREVIKTMFPGYILVETDNILEFNFRVLGKPRIINILRNNSYFNEIRREEISSILSLINVEGLIEVSEAFMIEDKVKIINGPLHGKEGIIKKVDKRKGRAKVEFYMFCERRLIDLGINLLQKYNDSIDEMNKI